jgi:hypothetical protein
MTKALMHSGLVKGWDLSLGSLPSLGLLLKVRSGQLQGRVLPLGRLLSQGVPLQECNVSNNKRERMRRVALLLRRRIPTSSMMCRCSLQRLAGRRIFRSPSCLPANGVATTPRLRGQQRRPELPRPERKRLLCRS